MHNTAKNAEKPSEVKEAEAAEMPKPAPEKKAARTAADQKASFKVILKYMKAEGFQFFLGMVYLFLGQTADFCVPLFIGFVMTAIEKGEFDKIGTLCW